MSKKGFTLIEIIIYVAIFALMVVFVLGIVMRIGESVSLSRMRTNMVNETDFILGKMRWAMYQAQSFGEPTGTSTSSRLVISTLDPSNDPIVFELSGGAIYMSRGSGSSTRLTSRNIQVENLDFKAVPQVVSSPPGVQMSLSFRPKDPTVAGSSSIQTSFYLRQ